MNTPAPHNSMAARGAACLFWAAVLLRNAAYRRLPFLAMTAPMPVISVGGLHAGGTGKTPLADMIIRHLSAQGLQVILASRGYRRRSRTPVLLDPGQAAPWELVGDEPAMLRKHHPALWLAIGPKRGRLLARAAGRLPPGAPGVAVLDDGFQHRQLRRQIDIVCLAPNPWQDHMLPRGYLREPFEALTRAHIVCIIGAQNQKAQMERDAQRLTASLGIRDTFIITSSAGHWVHAASGATALRPALKRPVLACGIARPHRFVELVEKQGITPVATRTFPDHHRYRDHELASLLQQHEADGILTTEKDAIRINTQNLAIGRSIWYLTLKQEFAEADAQHRFFAILQAATLCQEATS